jgi:uncharacterized protein involved in tolerance to divalent cations
MEYSHVVVFITIDTPSNAQKLADKLLSARKGACVNIIPKVSSQYWWQGKIEKADELMLVVKTRAALLDELITGSSKTTRTPSPKSSPSPLSAAIRIIWPDSTKKRDSCSPNPLQTKHNSPRPGGERIKVRVWK